MRIILWMMPAGMGWVRVNRLNPAVAAMGLAAGLSSSLDTAAANLANPSGTADRLLYKRTL